jgi:hypothetical protein
VQLEILAGRDSQRSVRGDFARERVHREVLVRRELTSRNARADHEGRRVTAAGNLCERPRVPIFLLVDPVELRNALVRFGEPGRIVLPF